MTRDEALQAWQMIASIYGLHPERVGRDAPTWIDALEPMDVEIVASIANEWIHGNGPERLPTIVAFAASVHREAEKRRRPRPTIATELPKPTWVYAWEIAREERLEVALPEQEGGYRQLGFGWPPEDRRLLIAGTPEYVELMRRGAERAVTEVAREALVEVVPDCRVCRDDGWVTVGYRTLMVDGEVRQGSEQMASCPVCAKGRMVEFPLDRRGPWGDGGFWANRPYRIVRAGVVEVTS